MTTEPTNGGAPPRIDPTVVTKEAIDMAKEDLRREIAASKELTDLSRDSLRTEVMSDIRRVNDVADQKFDSVAQRFEEREIRFNTAVRENRVALDTALAAAKEAVEVQNKSDALSITKAEVATQKQIDALVELFNTRTDSLNIQIGDVKSRLDRGEGTVHGEDKSAAQLTAEKAQATAKTSMFIAAVGGAAYLIYLVLAISTKGKF